MVFAVDQSREAMNTAFRAKLFARISLLMLASFATACQGTRDVGPRSFQHDADGAQAPVDLHLTITADAPGLPISLASGGGVCDNYLFLADPRQQAVHQVDLRDGSRVRSFGVEAEAQGSLKSPETVVPDCRENVLFVVDAGGLLRFDLATGALIRRLPRGRDAGAALGQGLRDGDDFLVLPAIRFADRSSVNGRGSTLRGAALGYRQHVAQEDAGAPMLGLLTDECRSPSSCTRVGIDRIAGREAGWVACQAASHEVGVYSAEGELVRRIDVRSPRFLDDGSRVRAGAAVAAGINWAQRNSSVIWCGAFLQYVATVHFTFEAGAWSPGVAMKPTPFLNVHHIDGTPVVADLALSDLPVAKDHDSIYVVVYGDARSSAGERRLELQRIRMVDTDGASLDARIRGQR